MIFINFLSQKNLILYNYFYYDNFQKKLQKDFIEFLDGQNINMAEVCLEYLKTINFGNSYDSNVKYKREINPLIRMCWYGNLTGVLFLVKNGVNIEHLSFNNTTPIMFAFENGHLAIVKYLFQKGAKIVSYENKMIDYHNKMSIDECLELIDFLGNRSSDNVTRGIQKEDLQEVRKLVQEEVQKIVPKIVQKKVLTLVQKKVQKVIREIIPREVVIVNEAPKKVVRKAIKKKVIRDASKEVVGDDPKKFISEVPKEVVNEVPKEVVNEVSKEVPKEVVNEVPKEVVNEVSKEIIEEVLKKVSEQNSKNHVMSIYLSDINIELKNLYKLFSSLYQSVNDKPLTAMEYFRKYVLKELSEYFSKK